MALGNLFYVVNGFINRLFNGNVRYNLPSKIELTLTPKHFMEDGLIMDENLLYNRENCAIAKALKEYLGGKDRVLDPVVYSDYVEFEPSGSRLAVMRYNIGGDKGSIVNLSNLHSLVEMEEEFDGEDNVIKLTRL